MNKPNLIATLNTTLRRRALLIAVVVNMAICFAHPKPANSQTVTFHFQATINTTDGLSAFAVGDTITGSYTFNSVTPDLDGSAERGEYEAVISLTFTTSGGYSGSAIAASSNGLIEVLNDTPGTLTRDRYVMGLQAPGQTFTAPGVDGHALVFFNMVLRSSLTTTFPSDALPLIPPSLADFDRGKEINLGFGPGGSPNVRALVTSLTVETNDPVTQINTLIEAVEVLGSTGALGDGLSQALQAKLDAALEQVDSHPQAAVGALTAFIQQVTTLVRRGVLSSQQGEALITAAQQVIGELTAP